MNMHDQLNNYFNKVSKSKGSSLKEVFTTFKVENLGWATWKKTDKYLLLGFTASPVSNFKEFQAHAAALTKVVNTKYYDFPVEVVCMQSTSEFVGCLVIAEDYQSLATGKKQAAQHCAKAW